jgi:hypothetical protein
MTESHFVPVKYLRARCGVRYWEDGTVNGEKDSDGSRIPCRDPKPNDRLGGGDWLPLIELETGKIVGWPEGTTADIHYKVCDDGEYMLLSEDCKTVVKKIDGYVPGIMCPEGDGDGDYVIMKIGPNGSIANWKVDLSEFESED